ncbi:MAG: hypothetical protein JW726_05615 [Anaerolineales bacterium]|nr:hypothetical protein [Anaerolineales bacterium]
MKKNMTTNWMVAVLAAALLVAAIALTACQPSTVQPTQAQPEATTPPDQTQPEATTPPEQTQPEATTPPAETTAIDGATLLDERCSTCHGANKVRLETNTREGWDAIVTEMIGKGAKLTEEEKAALVDYLTQNYGK